MKTDNPIKFPVPLFVLHLLVCYIYSISFVESNILFFLAYCLVSLLAFGVVFSIFPMTDSRVRIYAQNAKFLRIIAISFILYMFLFYDQISLPDFFLGSYAEKIEVKSGLPNLLHGFIFIGLMLLGSLSKNGLDKVIVSVAIFLLYLSSGSTSRGGLLIYFAPIFLLLRENLFFKLAVYILLPVMAAFFLKIVMVRIGLDQLNLSDVISAELQTEKSGGLINLDDGYQQDRFKLFLFFLPSAIKGDWIATNHYISEALLGLSRDQLTFYVITLGDFSNFYFGYGDFWFIFAAFGLIVSLLLTRFLSYMMPEFKGFFFFLFILVGSRVGVESLLPILLWGYILPLMLHYALSRMLDYLPKLNLRI